MSHNLKFLLAALLISLTAQANTVEITQLPLGAASSTTNADVFPFVNVTTNITTKMTVWDLVNVPAFVSTYAPLASPTFTGTATIPTLHLTNPLTVPYGGSGIASGTSGGLLYFSDSTTIASSGAMTQYALLTGGGAGNPPVALAAATNGQIPTGVTGGAMVYTYGHPTGEVIAFANSTCPTGTLLANGASVSTSTYAALYAVIGYTFGGSGASMTLPDLRGIFVRGSGSNGTINTAAGGNYAATYGTYTTDEIQGHNHTVVDPGHNHTQNAHSHQLNYEVGTSNTGSSVYFFGTSINNNTTANQFSQSGSSVQATTATNIANTTGITVTTATNDGTNGGPRLGVETRPANLALQYCIYY